MMLTSHLGSLTWGFLSSRRIPIEYISDHGVGLTDVTMVRCTYFYRLTGKIVYHPPFLAPLCAHAYAGSNVFRTTVLFAYALQALDGTAGIENHTSVRINECLTSDWAVSFKVGLIKPSVWPGTRGLEGCKSLTPVCF